MYDDQGCRVVSEGWASRKMDKSLDINESLGTGGFVETGRK